jgi:rare lipoprotein A
MALEERPVQTAAMAGMSGDASIPKGVYLQLGAFSNADNAENLKNHLLRELDWVGEAMRVNSGGGIHRLHLGPYASRSDAEKVAERIRADLGFRPTFVTR